MTPLKGRQRGSIGGIVVLAALAFLVWWQWDWIAGLFGVSLPSLAAPEGGLKDSTGAAARGVSTGGLAMCRRVLRGLTSTFLKCH